MSPGRFTVLDLFSGIGGFALATEWAGGRTAAFAEIDTYAASVLRRHWPHVPNLGDVTQICRASAPALATADYLARFGRPDVIAGGVPCQPASKAGQRKGREDARWLWPEALRIVGELRPTFALFENPSALLSLENGDAFRGILSGLSDLGYSVQWDCLSAAALGAGHRRKRLWLLASDSTSPRLEGHRGHVATHRDAETGGHFAASDFRARKIECARFYTQSGARPLADGIPRGLARQQLTAIGNSLVPQCAAVWLRAIASFYL